MEGHHGWRDHWADLYCHALRHLLPLCQIFPSRGSNPARTSEDRPHLPRPYSLQRSTTHHSREHILMRTVAGAWLTTGPQFPHFRLPRSLASKVSVAVDASPHFMDAHRA